MWGKGSQCLLHPVDGWVQTAPGSPSPDSILGVEDLGVPIWNYWIVLGHAYMCFRHQDWSCCCGVWIFRQYASRGTRSNKPPPVLPLLFRDFKVSLQQLCELCRGSCNDAPKRLQGCHFLGLPRRGPLPPIVCCPSHRAATAAGIGGQVCWVGAYHIPTVDAASLQWAMPSNVTVGLSALVPAVMCKSFAGKTCNL